MFALINLSRTSRLHVLQTAFLIHVAKGAVWDRIFSSTLTGCVPSFREFALPSFLDHSYEKTFKFKCASITDKRSKLEQGCRYQAEQTRDGASQGILKAKMKPFEEEMLCCAIRNNMHSLAHDMDRRYAKQDLLIFHASVASTVLSDTDTQGT